MSTHNICFHDEIRKNISIFRTKKNPYLELHSFNFLSDIVQEEFVDYVNVSDVTDGENILHEKA